MNFLSEQQLSVVRSNSQNAIKSGLAFRYFQALTQDSDQIASPPDGTEETVKKFMMELAVKFKSNSSAEADIAYQRLEFKDFSKFLVVLFDVEQVSVIDSSQQELGFVMATRPQAMALSVERSNLFVPEDLQVLVAGYTAQVAVGLNTIIDIDMSRWG